MIGKSKKSKRFTIKNKNTLSDNSKPKKKKVLPSKTKVKNAIKCEYNGIDFKSKLEMFMYKELETQKLFLDYLYENISFTLMDSLLQHL